MNLDQIDEQLKELADQYFHLKRAQDRLFELDRQMLRLYADLDQHKLKMNKEHQDVLALEKLSKYYLFVQILGGSSDRLERERQEYMQAVLEYNSIAKELELLEFEKKVLSSKVGDIDDIKRRRDYYLKLKEQKFLFHNTKEADTIRQLNREIDQLRSFLRELKEAKIAAVEVDRSICLALKNLKRVEKFGSAEMYGAGAGSAFAKKQYIDKAISGAIKINYQLNKLEKELSDVYASYVFLTINKYQNFIDSFYDHLITDWVLKSKLTNAVNALQLALAQVQRIQDTLDNDTARSDKKVVDIIEKKRQVVLEAGGMDEV